MNEIRINTSAVGERANRQTNTRKRVLSFREAYEEVAQRINAERLCQPNQDRPTGKLHVILKVMADMYTKAPSALVTIGGEDMAARDVQAVYDEIGEAEVYDILGRMEDAEPVAIVPFVRSMIYYVGLEAGL